MANCGRSHERPACLKSGAMAPPNACSRAFCVALFSSGALQLLSLRRCVSSVSGVRAAPERRMRLCRHIDEQATKHCASTTLIYHRTAAYRCWRTWWRRSLAPSSYPVVRHSRHLHATLQHAIRYASNAMLPLCIAQHRQCVYIIKVQFTCRRAKLQGCRRRRRG